jgi:hypothetical protein
MSFSKRAMLRLLAMPLLGASITAGAAAQVQVTTVALSGTQAPGFATGIVHREFYELPWLDLSGRVAFKALTTDPVHNYGWYQTDPAGAGAAIVARSRDPAAGAAGFDYSASAVFLLGEGGGLSFGFELLDSGTLNRNGHGVFVGTPGDIRLAARTAVPVPELGGGTFSSLVSGLATNGTTTVFRAEAHLNSDATSTAGLWTASTDGTLRTLALETGSMAFAGFMIRGIDQSGRAGFLAGGRPYTGAPGDIRQATYTGRAYGPLASYTASGAWIIVDAPARAHVYAIDPSGTISSLADTGKQPAGMPTSFRFSYFDEFSPSRSGRNVAFCSALAGPDGVDEYPMSAFAHINGTLRLLSRPGLPAPQLGAEVLFNLFPDAVVNDAGQILLSSYLQGPGVTSANDRAIWYDDGDGVMRVLLREGHPFSFDGMTKTVLGYSASFASSGAFGGNGFNNSGQFVTSISFTDGSSGVFLFQIPEPSGALLALGGIALLGAGWRRRR